MKQAPSNTDGELGITGVSPLSDRDLLTLLLGEHGKLTERSSLSDLARASLPELMALGLPEAQAVRLLAVFELGRRSRKGGPLPQTLGEPDDAYALLYPHLEDALGERFMVVVLDVRNRPRHVAQVAQGSVDHCVVDPRDVFAPAIREHGTAVLIAHNHPSGDPTPSPEDIELTQRLVHAGDLIGMPVLDHVIIATGPHVDERRKFVSLAALGTMLGGRVASSREARKPRRKASVSEGPGVRKSVARKKRKR